MNRICMLALSGALAGCLSATDAEVMTEKVQEPNLAQFQARLREIARTYEAYQRVDDELHWAPGLCRQPQPSHPRLSASTDADTHGRKLYFVFAADRSGYLERDGRTPGMVGQVLVKEAWVPEEVPADTRYDEQATPVRYLRQGDRLYHAGTKAGLFILYRLDPGTPDTDDGWVYGTVQADGATVTSAGPVRSCMGCHLKALKGRLFGIGYQGA